MPSNSGCIYQINNNKEIRTPLFFKEEPQNTGKMGTLLLTGVFSLRAMS